MMMAVLLCFGIVPSNAFAAEYEYDGYISMIDYNGRGYSLSSSLPAPFGGTFDDLVFNGDFDGLSVLGDFYREDFFRQYEGFRRCDFTHEEVSSRHIIKLKVPDFIALGDHEGGFFGKLRFVKTEQADNSAA